MIRLILFLVVSVMAAGGTGIAENNSICSVDMVPIQIVRNTGHSAVTALSEADISDFPPGFFAFVNVVTEHLAVKLDQEKLCLSNTKGKEQSLIQFAAWAIYSGPQTLPSVPPLKARSSGVCRISSPWIDITIERNPVPWVRAVIRYSERQLLADQAMLTGVPNVPLGVAVPLKRDEFERYADSEYARSEIQHWPAWTQIEKRVPPDLLWLFRRAGQETDSRFSAIAGSSMRKAMKTGTEGYTNIVIALIDRCFASEGADIQYNSILDVADLVPLEEYKIVTSIVQLPIDF